MDLSKSRLSNRLGRLIIPITRHPRYRYYYLWRTALAASPRLTFIFSLSRKYFIEMSTELEQQVGSLSLEFVEGLLADYLQNPDSVSARLAHLLRRYGPQPRHRVNGGLNVQSTDGHGNGHGLGAVTQIGPSFRPSSLFNPPRTITFCRAPSFASYFCAGYSAASQRHANLHTCRRIRSVAHGGPARSRRSVDPCLPRSRPLDRTARPARISAPRTARTRARLLRFHRGRLKSRIFHRHDRRPAIDDVAPHH